MATRNIESVQPTGARYVDGDERENYVDRPMRIAAVHPEPKATYGARHVIDAAMLSDGELIALSFADNATRVAMFGSVATALDAGDEFAPVCLYLAAPTQAGGNAYWAFRTATDDEIASAEAEAANDDSADEAPVETAPKGKGK